MSIANMNRPIETPDYKLVNDALAAVIAFAESNVKRHSHLREYAYTSDPEGRVRYFRELRTINFNAGRQSGNTTWIVANSSEDDLVLTRGVISKKDLLVSWTLAEKTDPPTVWTNRDFNLKAPEFKDTRKFKRVIIDEASYLFDGLERNRFYKMIDPVVDLDTLFIFLG